MRPLALALLTLELLLPSAASTPPLEFRFDFPLAGLGDAVPVALAMSGSSQSLVLDNGGRAWYTANRGRAWRKVWAASRDVKGVGLINGRQGWVRSFDDVYLTSDAGSSWAKVAIPQLALQSVKDVAGVSGA